MHFNITEIPETIEESMKTKRIWRDECPVPIDNLRLLEVSHVDFKGLLKKGQMVVHKKLAGNVIDIFKELLQLKFPIHKVKLIDDYEGNDELSMADNNSSAFIFRNIPGSATISMHSYGLAIDVNPVQNPYISINQKENKVTIHPQEGLEFLNRHNIRPGMLEPFVKIFQKHGLDVWGGKWNSPIDYHHFQIQGDRRQEFLEKSSLLS